MKIQNLLNLWCANIVGQRCYDNLLADWSARRSSRWVRSPTARLLALSACSQQSSSSMRNTTANLRTFLITQ